MRAPLEWLADYVDIDVPVDDLAERLTMAGLKVEAIERLGADWHDVLIGQVVKLEPHPTSRNPLSVTEVDVGRDERLTIVTGAPNVKQGDKVPVVMVGGMLPHGPDGQPVLIECKPMAGIASSGMLASEYELGISDEHSGILILPEDVRVGEHLGTVLGGEVLDIETNPNRPDTLAVVGVAREVAAITEQQVSFPDVEAITGEIEKVDAASLDVRIEASDLCPRFTAVRIQGVESVPSPLWLAHRLRQAGMRPINLLVDLTNYVMLELGQPMHAFDARQLAGGRIVVRRAQEGEVLTTLDGAQRVLSSDQCVIADAERLVSLAGIMGGENSEISAGTTDMILEAANWNPISIRRTAKELGLRTEASLRFEKGLPPEQTLIAIQRYLQLLAQLWPHGLRIYRIADVYERVPAGRHVEMPLRDVRRLTGLPISSEQVEESLSLLGFSVEHLDGVIRAEVPFWRRTDIERSADLVEEVIRIVGYDRIPVTLPDHTTPPLPWPDGLGWEFTLIDRLLGLGLNESTTHSLTSPASMTRLLAAEGLADLESPDSWTQVVPNAEGIRQAGAEIEPVRLENPATLDRQVLRISLVPSLLDVLSRNERHTDERLAFFEVARTYFARREDLPHERRTLAIVLAGLRVPSSWSDPAPGPYGFFDLKGILSALTEALNIHDWTARPAGHPSLHPGRSAAFVVGDVEVGWFGELHPAVAERFDLSHGPVQVAELDLDALFPAASDDRRFHELPRFPEAKRDLAVVVREEVPAEAVLALIRGAGGELLESARIFDIYRGSTIPSDHKSVAVSLALRAREHTLSENEVGGVMSQIVAALEKELGGTLRD